MNKRFRRFATIVSSAAGNPVTFLLALVIVALWAVTGPMFKFSNTWQLIINTGTTIVTFLMVFLIQNTQNRDSKAMQLKLDELIRSTNRARNSFIDIEELSDEDLAIVNLEFQALANSNPDPAIVKLHAKLEAAQHIRKNTSKQGIVAQTGQVMGQVIQAIGHLGDTSKPDDKK